MLNNPCTDLCVVTCPNCDRNFDAMRARWCLCVAEYQSPACSACGTCLCKRPPSEQLAFWMRAPEALLQRRQRGNATAPEVASDGQDERPRVLIVDDNEEIRLVAACRIQELGYVVTTAAGPYEALELLEQESFALVLTDALMPRLDGRDLCLRIKNLHPFIKVVIMTALYTANRYKGEARARYGADDYVTKPIDFQVLTASLTRLVPLPAKRGKSLAG